MTRLNFGITSRPCWLKQFTNEVLKDFKLHEEADHLGNPRTVLSYDLVGSPYRWRVEPVPEGMPRSIYAPDGFELPDEPFEVLLCDVKHWGWKCIVFDAAWFFKLPIEHDGLAERTCEECAEQDAWVTGPGWREELERRRKKDGG
jgi:hypothetical protein